MRLFAAAFALLLSLLALPHAANAVVRVKVDLSTQTMHVTSDSGARYTWPVSTARSGFVTPRGTYRPQRLAKMHYSRKYHMSPMPHSIFFRGGYAIHGTNEARALGRPASHGCIRLSKANAATLFALVQKEGAVIAIDGTAPRGTMVAGKATPKKKTVVAGKRHKSPSQMAGKAQPMPLGYAPMPASAAPLKAWGRNPGAGWYYPPVR